MNILRVFKFSAYRYVTATTINIEISFRSKDKKKRDRLHDNLQDRFKYPLLLPWEKKISIYISTFNVLKTKSKLIKTEAIFI